MSLDQGTGYLGFYNGSLHTTGYSVPVGVWTHIVMTMSNSSCSFYANGVLQSTLSSCGIGAADNTSIPVQIGTYVGAGADQQQFYGSMDDVRIYNRALSLSEIKQLYGLGGGTTLKK